MDELKCLLINKHNKKVDLHSMNIRVQDYTMLVT